MSLKILLDPIYSNPLPSCSTAFKCKAIVEAAHAHGRDDWFFYWIVRPDLTDAEREWLPQTPNVRYLPLFSYKDRLREYLRFPDALDQIIAFNGDVWDYDVLWTVRSEQIPTMRAVMSAPRQNATGRKLKKIVACEEMILLDYKDSIALSDIPAQELMTVSGYLAADMVTIQTRKERSAIIHRARQYLSPSKVMELNSRLREVVPMTQTEMETKPPEVQPDGKRPFCLGFAGRVEKVAASLEDLYKAMEYGWIMPGDTAFRVVMCTQSKSWTLSPPPFVDIRRATREQFWTACRTEMDVQLIMHRDGEFGLSLIEPMMLGVPQIIVDKPWAHEIWGKEYPFFAQGFDEVLGIVRAFQEDYAGMYAKWHHWRNTYWREAITTGRYSVNMHENLYRFCLEHEERLDGPETRDLFKDRKNNPHFQKLLEQAHKMGDFTLFDLIRATDGIDAFKEKLAPNDRDTRRLVFSTPWHEMRLMLKHEGFVDASVETGHLRRI